MSEKKHVEAILAYLAEQQRPPVKVRKLARRMGISDDEYGAFRRAYKKLRDSGRLLLGSASALTLPTGAGTMIGRFQANPRGFGFVVPEEPDSRGDLFVPADRTGGALTGDLVVARVIKRGKRQGKLSYGGEVIEIRERGLTRVVGTIEQADGTWFALPDGRRLTTPVLVRDVPPEARRPGLKVVVELTRFPGEGELPEGVVVETLGRQGRPAVEIRAVLRTHGIAEQFGAAALDEARRVSAAFAPEQAADREDLTGSTVITIDPDDARDYDDAISLEAEPDGALTLGVHIADVSHFVRPGGALDAEALERGTSVYFPRQVVPMLPPLLSNGVCSLQEGVPRFAKSVFITYDGAGRVLRAAAAQTVIRSTKRLTYRQAQQICDGGTADCPRPVVRLVRDLEGLARRIEARRTAAGMLHLALPEVELTLDDGGRVVDAAPADDSYTHKMIEMFMVEANEAVAGAFAVIGTPIVRRIHPPPEEESLAQLRGFVQACGHRLPAHPTPHDLQRLVATVAGRPESQAVNLAVLRSLQRAVYSVEPAGHFALASQHYCHFTSPIRRYPDLTVHRELEAWLAGRPGREDRVDLKTRARLADQLTASERKAQAAELELRLVLILQHLAGKVGEEFDGVITGVTDFGVFVQSPRFLVEGLIRLPDLGDDWWEVFAQQGKVRGQVTGVQLRIGDLLPVRIAAVNVARRQLDLVPATPAEPAARKKRRR